jgi:hypothetical protein
MLNWSRKSSDPAVNFCDRCEKICDASCRAEVLREQALLRALRFGVRV